MIRLITPALIFAASSTFAEVPRVITDFAPIYSLTAQVMQGVGTPDNLLPAGAEPHDYDMSPRDAANLAGADLMIWTGAALTPWLADPIAALAPDARQLVLLDTDGWASLPMRDDADDDHVHNHGKIDPHAWLDPQVAAVWVDHIAESLAEIDPKNSATYRANAVIAKTKIETIATDIDAILDGVSGAYILPHDGYQYFENRFDIPAIRTIAATDAHEPGPSRISELRDIMQSNDIKCVLTDRETDPAWADLLSEGTDAKTAEIDATAAAFPIGPDAYGQMMRALAHTLADCLR